MARSRCPNCGAAIDLAEDVDTEENVPLDVFTDSSTDAPRYRFVGHNPLRVKKVEPRTHGDHFPDHRFDCPAHYAGRP